MILVVGVLCATVWNCSERDRSNPLDPKNPDTEGKPAGFALAPASSYTDVNLEYDQKVTYRISVSAEEYESPFSDSVSIVPGPDNYWIADLYGGMVAKLTYDARHFISYTISLPRPIAVLPDSATGGAWVLDSMGYLYQLSADADVVTWIEGLVEPGHITGNYSRSSIWVSNFSGTQISRYDWTGLFLGAFSGFKEIADIEWADVLESCWIADKKAKSIRLYSQDGDLEIEIDSTLTAPSAVSYYQKGGWLWVADSLKLTRVWPDGKVENVLDTDIPIHAISADQTNGDCWIIREAADWQSDLLKVTPAGIILVTVTDFYSAESVQANSFNGGCLVADSGNGRIVRISQTGEVLSSQEGFITPWDIVVE
jgi:hypothetical protein